MWYEKEICHMAKWILCQLANPLKVLHTSVWKTSHLFISWLDLTSFSCIFCFSKCQCSGVVCLWALKFPGLRPIFMIIVLLCAGILERDTCTCIVLLFFFVEVSSNCTNRWFPLLPIWCCFYHLILSHIFPYFRSLALASA